MGICTWDPTTLNELDQMVQILSEFYGPKVHDVVTPKSLDTPNPELRNVKMLKWLPPPWPQPYSKSASCFATLGFSMQSAPAPCHQDFWNVEPRNLKCGNPPPKGFSGSYCFSSNGSWHFTLLRWSVSTIHFNSSTMPPLRVYPPRIFPWYYDQWLYALLIQQYLLLLPEHVLPPFLLKYFQSFKGLNLFFLYELNYLGYHLRSRNSTPLKLCSLWNLKIFHDLCTPCRVPAHNCDIHLEIYLPESLGDSPFCVPKREIRCPPDDLLLKPSLLSSTKYSLTL